jgi:hypothetical protein
VRSHEGTDATDVEVELYAAIRRDARAGLSGCALERKYNVGRRTAVKALASAWPQPRKKPLVNELVEAADDMVLGG